MLLLHGSGPGTTAAAWAPLIAALRGRFHVLAPDLIGFGDAQGVRPCRLRSMWTEQACDLVDGLGEPFAVVGNSAGGAIALSLAHARPRVVTRVVAVGSMGHPMPISPGLDELWGYTPSREAARALVALISEAPVTDEAVDARLQASLLQPGYGELFPSRRGRTGRVACRPARARHAHRCRCATGRWLGRRLPDAARSAAPAMPRRSSAPTSSTVRSRTHG